MKLRTLLQYLEQIAPPAYQESYDNAGLIVGDFNAEITGVLICLDSLESTIDEAIEKNCNVIIAHHPIVFRGLKRFNGRGYVERIVMKAIKNDIAIYAAHTNLDNVHNGVNAKICEKLGLVKTRILAPKKGLLKKLYTFVPVEHSDAVRNALFNAGAGKIGDYEDTSFNLIGAGSFKAGANTNPHVGEKGKRHYEAETKIEVIFPAILEGKIINALKQTHPYEEVAYDVITLDNVHQRIGSGMIGELEEPMEFDMFLLTLKETMQAGCIRYTKPLKQTVKKIAVCGGAGSFLLRNAISKKADVFITADYKYHEFFDADNQIVIADIGHYESEQYTIELFYELITQKFRTFAVHKTQVNTNPINYL